MQSPKLQEELPHLTIFHYVKENYTPPPLTTIGSWVQKKEPNAVNNQGNRTVLAYLFGDVSLWEYLETSVNEMEKGWDPNNNGTLLVYFDASPKLTQFRYPVLLKIQHDTTDQIVSPIVRTYPDQDAGDPDLFANILKDANELYPANSYGLIIGGHGNGWIPKEHSKSIDSSDRFDGQALDIDALAKALPTHYDFVIFHACMMGETASLYQLRDKTNYVVASVESLPAQAFPYHNVIHTLFT